jgi:high-affinity nickel permease
MNEVLLLFSTASTLGVLGFGFLQGLRHATDADHLAAVSTIVSERKSLLSSALIGGFWGLGHTISLFIVGIFVLLMSFQISEQTERLLEFGVGVMLLLLGLNVLRKLAHGGHLHFHTHEHGAHAHAHPHIHERGHGDDPQTHHGLKFSPRSVVIGMIHGLAGSAGLMLVVIPTIDSKFVGLLYILIFGVGSIGGMMLMSLLVGLPFHFTANRLNRLNHILQSIAGLFSAGLGLFIIYEKGIVEGLLS